MWLAYWVINHLKPDTGNYISSPLNAQLSTRTFLKEVGSVMAALNFNPAKVRTAEGRGYRGLGFIIKEENKHESL